MDLNVVALLGVAITTTLLSLVVYSRAPSRRANRLWALHQLVVSFWALGTLLLSTAHDTTSAMAYLKLVHVIASLEMAIFVDFCWIFPERAQGSTQYPRRALYLVALVFAAIASLPNLARSMTLTPYGPDIEFGWPLMAYGTYALGTAFYVIVYMWIKARSQHGVARVQTVYVLVGVIGFAVLIILVNVVLPMVTGDTRYSRWGVVAYFFNIILTTTAMAKHSLWDLNTLGRRGAAALLTVGTMAAGAALCIGLMVHAFPVFVGEPVLLATFWVLVGSGLGVGGVPIYRWFRGLLARSDESNSQRISRLLSELGALIVHPPETGDVHVPILDQTQRYFGASFAATYVRDAGGAYRNVAYIDRRPAAPHDLEGPRQPVLPADSVARLGIDGLEEPLCAGQLLRFGDREQVNRQLRAMEAVEASIVVPLTWLGSPLGVFLLGHKLSRAMYSSSDVDLLKSIAAHAAIAVNNSELRASIIAEKERTEKIITQMESGVVAVDAEGQISVINPAACEMLLVGDAELVGANLDALPGPLRDALAKASDEGAGASDHTSLPQGEGELRVAVSTFVLEGPAGGREGAGVVFRDLSTEDALHLAEQEAEHLRFVRAVSAGMAHEIRNPLVAIRTFAELAPQRLDDPEFRESFMEVAQSEVGRLEQLVSQFMTLAKPAREVRSVVDVRQLVDDVLSTVSARAEVRKVRLSSKLPQAPTALQGDELRLHQCLLNLLLNAVDAAPEGGQIELCVSERGTGGSEAGEVDLRVWNSGSYIPPEESARLFEPFYTTKSTGTGLGLAICHTIADEHGGTLSVASDENDGTAFTLTIPVQARPSAGGVAA